MSKTKWLLALVGSLILILVGASGVLESPMRADEPAVVAPAATPQAAPSATIEAKADNQPLPTVEAAPAPKAGQSARILGPSTAPIPVPRPQTPVQGVTPGNTLPVPAPKPYPLPTTKPVPAPTAVPNLPTPPEPPSVGGLLDTVTGFVPKIHIGTHL